MTLVTIRYLTKSKGTMDELVVLHLSAWITLQNQSPYPPTNLRGMSYQMNIRGFSLALYNKYFSLRYT